MDVRAARDAYTAATQSLYAFGVLLFLALATLAPRGLRDARIEPEG